MKVSVIGGTGGMGKTLIRFFADNGINAKAVGRKTLNPIQILEESDVIIVSVPSLTLKYAVSLLKPINLSKKLVVSLGSIMMFDAKRLSSIKSPVLHMHQLFGPAVYPFNGQKIVFSGDVQHVYAKKLTTLFKRNGVLVKVLSEAVHDSLMANIQAISQFSAIALAKTLSESKFKKKELVDTSTITFMKSVDSIERIMAQKAELWAFLQFENKAALKVMERHLKNVQGMIKMAKNKDYVGFAKMFNKIANFWK